MRSKEIDKDSVCLLSKPYRKKVGRITFQVSSFGNKQSSQTAQQLILQMLAEQIARGELKNQEE